MDQNIKRKRILHTIIFALVLVFALKAVSWLLVWSENSTNIIDNHNGRSIFLEKENCVDAVALGNSNFYCAIDPTYIWEDYGIPMYVWGEPSHRIFEIEHDLRKLFKHQSPKVVFIEASCLMREKSAVNAMNQKVKADFASVFEAVACHRNVKNFSPDRLGKWSLDQRCRSKGYCLRTGTKAYTGGDWMNATDKKAVIPDVAKRCLSRCIDICRENGAEVVLLSIPSPNDWSMKRYNAVSELAQELDVELLDLNMHMDEIGLDWTKDTCDEGHHMNYIGAKKNSEFLGKYLSEEKQLADHKGEDEYEQWDQDCKEYAEARDKVISAVDPDWIASSD